MVTTNGNDPAQLIVARFNYSLWTELTNEEHGKAEDAAERMFPEHGAAGEETPPPVLPYPPGVLLVRTFKLDSDIRLPEGYPMLSREEKIGILEPIFREKPSPVVGWMAVVDPGYFSSFMGLMNSDGGFLWRMYDVEILPLAAGWTKESVLSTLPTVNDDQTTLDIYLEMAVRSWS